MVQDRVPFCAWLFKVWWKAGEDLFWRAARGLRLISSGIVLFGEHEKRLPACVDISTVDLVELLIFVLAVCLYLMNILPISMCKSRRRTLKPCLHASRAGTHIELLQDRNETTCTNKIHGCLISTFCEGIIDKKLENFLSISIEPKIPRHT